MNHQLSELLQEELISSPTEFESFLGRLLKLLQDGRLRQTERREDSVLHIDLQQIKPAGPWPDIIEAEFVDDQGRRYHLFVDCYHGTGGRWSRLAGK